MIITTQFRITHVDGLGLHQDLYSISNWAGRRQIEFNVSKCKLIHFGKGNIGNRCIMDKQPIEEVDSEKERLSGLKSIGSLQRIIFKATCILGLISGTIKYRNPKSVVSLYKSLVQPQLDYCSTVLYSHYSKDKSLLEGVRHRFTRLFPHLRGLPYEET